MSTNKVYGDSPNEVPLKELPKRWDYARPEDFNGIREDCRIDRTTHSVLAPAKPRRMSWRRNTAVLFGI